ncbi:MAG TPA: class I mannose-6-phosphate isomerase [Acidimicrobiales bacterium]|nr:class I mannose-6-phosphate isomerase [Acidimicrobiales bacterium]
MLQPVKLEANQPRQFYRGGAAIAAFRGEGGRDDFRPEDWVGSTTPRYKLAPDGLSQVEEGTYLRDLVEADPERWLGPEHVRAFGSSTELLVKLLDAGERLPVHLHPPRSFAYPHLGSRHGKTEAWVVLGTRGAEPAVYVGWAVDVEPSQLARWVEEQEPGVMLGALHKLEVRPGDGVLVPAGTPHAIGEGVFALEVQEPTDFSIILETEGFDIDPASAYLGLSREVALSCVQHRALSRSELESLRQAAPSRGDRGLAVEEALPSRSRPYFRVERLLGGAQRLPASFSIVVGVHGRGLLSGTGWEIPLHGGQTVLVPWEAGPVSLNGSNGTGNAPVEALRCLPPLPTDFAQDDPVGIGPGGAAGAA